MHPASSMARFGAGAGAPPSAAFQALSVRPLAAPSLPARSGKVIGPKRCFIVSNRLAWVDDELMEIEKSEEESPIKLKKRPPLRRGKIYPQLSVPEHIPRPSYVGSKGLPELCSVRQIHDAEGIAGMRAACKLAARVLDFAGKLVKPSVTTNEIDTAVHNMIIEAGAYPSPLGYHGFPKSVCTSVNECVCHGIPDSTQLQNGDIINIDVNVFLNGYHGGTSRTFVCGKVDDSINHFLKAAEECLDKGISVCKDGVNYRKIGKKISKLAYFYGYYVVERFVGHGIGTMYHSEPLILHHANENSGRMVEGQTFTIEPILTMEKTECVTWEDGWTTVTADGSWAAQFEHTILFGYAAEHRSQPNILNAQGPHMLGFCQFSNQAGDSRHIQLHIHAVMSAHLVADLVMFACRGRSPVLTHPLLMKILKRSVVYGIVAVDVVPNIR